MKYIFLSVKLSVEQMKEKHPEWSIDQVRAYAHARVDAKGRNRQVRPTEDFDPFTDDPNCKTCRKKKRRLDKSE